MTRTEKCRDSAASFPSDSFRVPASAQHPAAADGAGRPRHPAAHIGTRRSPPRSPPIEGIGGVDGYTMPACSAPTSVHTSQLTKRRTTDYCGQTPADKRQRTGFDQVRRIKCDMLKKRMVKTSRQAFATSMVTSAYMCSGNNTYRHTSFPYPFFHSFLFFTSLILSFFISLFLFILSNKFTHFLLRLSFCTSQTAYLYYPFVTIFFVGNNICWKLSVEYEATIQSSW